MNPPVFTLLQAASGVTAVLGTAPLRVYPGGQVPENTAYPYATYAVYNGNPNNNMDQAPLSDVIGTQIDIWSKTYGLALSAATAIRDALEPAAHMTGFSGPDRDDETRYYRVILEFDFFTERG